MEIESIYFCVAALDVHLNKIVVCIIRALESGEDEVLVKEFGGFKRDRRAMADWIADYSPECVVMESTGIYWKSPYTALERVGIHAKVVNPQHVAKVAGRKTDICDAQWLAMLARAGLMRASFIPCESVRHLRLIARHHGRLTSVITAEKNRLLKVLADGGMRLSALVSDPHGKACREMIGSILKGDTPEQAVKLAGKLKADRAEISASLDHELTDSHVYVANIIREHLTYLENSLAELERRLFTELKPFEPLIALLLTVPGMERLSICKILVEIGPDMAAFNHPGRLAAWCGLCPGNHESAGKRKKSKTRKGNPYVRTVLIEIALAAVKTRCYFREKFQSLHPRLGYKKAIVAIAHKIIRVIYLMLTRQECYNDKSEQFEKLRTERNAPRWIKALIKYGKLPAVA
jgi:transposase